MPLRWLWVPGSPELKCRDEGVVAFTVEVGL